MDKRKINKMIKECAEWISECADEMMQFPFPGGFYKELGGRLAFVMVWSKGNSYDASGWDEYADSDGHGVEVSLRHFMSEDKLPDWHFASSLDSWDHWDENNEFHPDKIYSENEVGKWTARDCIPNGIEERFHVSSSPETVMSIAEYLVGEYVRIVDWREKNGIDL